MSDLFMSGISASNKERAAYVKRRVSIDDALDALDLDTPLGVCSPCCDAIGMLKIHDGTERSEASASARPQALARTAREAGRGAFAICEQCGEGPMDVIDLARRARGFSFGEACKFLEEECAVKNRCSKTGDLFSKGGRR